MNEVLYLIRRIGSEKFFCWIIILIETRGVIFISRTSCYFKVILRNLEKEMLRLLWLINRIYKFRKVIAYYKCLWRHFIISLTPYIKLGISDMVFTWTRYFTWYSHVLLPSRYTLSSHNCDDRTLDRFDIIVPPLVLEQNSLKRKEIIYKYDLRPLSRENTVQAVRCAKAIYTLPSFSIISSGYTYLQVDLDRGRKYWTILE